MNHWNPILYENSNLVPASTDAKYYLTTDLADRAIAWVRKVKSIGSKVGEMQLARTIPVQISLGEGLDVGVDGGSPVDFTYKLPFAFTGRIEKVTFQLK